MKKFISLALSLTFMTSFVSCKKSTSEKSDVIPPNSINETESSTNKTSETNENVEISELAEITEFVNIDGVKVAIPNGFTETDCYTTTYSGKFTDTSEIYYSFDSDLYYNMSNDNYTYIDAPDIFSNTERSIVHNFYDYMYGKDTESIEQVDINDYLFLKQSGKFQTQRAGEEDYTDVYFIGYYGCMTVDDVEVPMMWLIMSDSSDDTAIMEQIMNKCIAKTEIIKE